mgnify:FL=1
MCGIVGYVGKEKALPIILNGLKFLEYRGYDSAGVAYYKNGMVEVKKKVGKIANLDKLINYDEDTYLGIGHTRWATHGKPSVTNAHPHVSGKFTVVHNGIIENYLELKDKLLRNGVSFKSETDTEIIAALLDYNYNGNILETIKKTLDEVRGSYALGIICSDDDSTLYTARLGSPLIIAHNDNGNFIASDVPAILKYTNRYYLLDDGEIATLTKDSITIYDKDLNKIEKEEKIFEGSPESAMLNGYDHYMIKEINEQPKVFVDTLNYYVENNNFKNTMPDFNKYNKIHIVACGSSYHVGLVGKRVIEEYANIPVEVYVASEYRYDKIFYNKDELVILISQSGETADTLAALRKAKNEGVDTLAIVNVVGSSISREADKTLYIKAGPEISVATTKAYSGQLLLLILIAIKLSNNLELLKELDGTLDAIKEILNIDLREAAEYIAKYENAFFIGRLTDYALCMEGALKLKEISYINCSAFAAGELKHGTISLINEGIPVISVCTEELIAEKTISNIKEVKARDAYVLFITCDDIEGDFYDKKIVIPKVSPLTQSLVAIIPLQILSYEIAKIRGCEIDKPRNLAKSVTVE